MASGNYTRYFIQPAIGFNKKAHHVSLVTRLSIVDFTHFADSTNPHAVLFFEPGIMGKVNFLKYHLFFNWQFGISSTVNGRNYPGLYLDHVPFNLSLGLGVRAGGFKPVKK